MQLIVLRSTCVSHSSSTSVSLIPFMVASIKMGEIVWGPTPALTREMVISEPRVLMAVR